MLLVFVIISCWSWCKANPVFAMPSYFRHCFFFFFMEHWTLFSEIFLGFLIELIFFQTFSQLCGFNYDTKTVEVHKAPWYIHDEPRFAFRGLLLGRIILINLVQTDDDYFDVSKGCLIVTVYSYHFQIPHDIFCQ